MEFSSEVNPQVYFRNNHIFLLPSIDEYSATSVPNTILEAMEAGCVVITPINKITSTVNALGYTIWDLKYNRDADYFHLELNETLTDDNASMLCAQMSLPTDYDGIGDIGSCFTIYT